MTAERLTDEEIAELERLEREAWTAPWVAHTFEIDCPCPNGEDCGDRHSCEQVEALEAYPASHEDPAPAGEGQCVVQIAVPGLESLAGPTAAFIAAARNALPSLLAELRALRSSREAPHVHSSEWCPATTGDGWCCSERPGHAGPHRCLDGPTWIDARGGAPAATGESAAAPHFFDKRAADALAREVQKLIDRKVIDSRSPAADALLDYVNPDATESVIGKLAAATGESAGGDPRAQGFREGVEAAVAFMGEKCPHPSLTVARILDLHAIPHGGPFGALAPSSDTGSPDTGKGNK